MARTVAIVVADGYADSGVAIACDVLRAANFIAQRKGSAAPFRIGVVATGQQLHAASGLSVQGAHTARWAANADIVLVPGLWATSPTEIDLAMARPDVRRIGRIAAAAYARGAVVGSSCSGAFILADAGLLNGRHCTTTWWLAPHLLARHPHVQLNARKALVIDGRILTAGAVFAQADLVLHLVARFAGPTIERQCAQLLLLNQHRTQATHMALHQLASNDSVVRAAETWVHAQLATSFTIAQLAHGVGLGDRTLARRIAAATGLSPIRFVQRIRVEAAVALLETTQQTFQEIAQRVGYQDCNALRRLLHREGIDSPRHLRSRRTTPGSATKATASNRAKTSASHAKQSSAHRGRRQKATK